MTHRALPCTAVALFLSLGAATACGDDAESPGTAEGGAPTAEGGAPTAEAGTPAAQGGAPTEGGAPTTAEAGAPTAQGGAPSGVCGAVEKEEAPAAGVHVVECTPITHATNPPSSGEHYPVWTTYGEHDFAVPRGYWVHNLEHGAVVVTYNCPEGCEEDLTAARTWLASLEPDAACSPGPARVLLIPDPLLDVQWAASSWGYTLRANCFDADTFSAFYEAHVGQPPAPEATICTPGIAIDPSSCTEP